jgi:hypothetical protein
MVAPISRIAVAIEAGVILAPLTLFAMYGAFLLLIAGALASEFWLLALLTLCALAALGCGWHIALTFVRFGHESLVSLPLVVWAAPIAAAVISVLALFANLTSGEIARSGGVGFKMFVLGSPAVLPLVHLAAERWMRANTSLERTRDR